MTVVSLRFMKLMNFKIHPISFLILTALNSRLVASVKWLLAARWKLLSIVGQNNNFFWILNKNFQFIKNAYLFF